MSGLLNNHGQRLPIYNAKEFDDYHPSANPRYTEIRNLKTPGKDLDNAITFDIFEMLRTFNNAEEETPKVTQEILNLIEGHGEDRLTCYSRMCCLLGMLCLL